MHPNPLISKLGYDPDARLVIFHADDLGMCRGSNHAFLDLSAAGIVKSGSIMLPCAWAPEMLQLCCDNPALDVGVHLTLTSEWPAYRWGPLTTCDRTSGLVDDAGFFWPATQVVEERLDVAAAVAELRAQIGATLDAGVDITHLDSHMGVVTIPALTGSFFQFGRDLRVPIFAPRQMDPYMRTMGIERVAEADLIALSNSLEQAGFLLMDYFRISPCYTPNAPIAPSAEVYEGILGGLLPGVTYFSLHPNTPGDIEAIDTIHAAWRIFEYDYFRSDRLRSFLQRENIVPIGLREIRTAMHSL